MPPAALGLLDRRVGAAVVGRSMELATIGQVLDDAGTGRLNAVTVEGEPGIGKTRLLLAAREMAAARGLTTIAVTADEEFRGPFLVARSIFASPEATEAMGDEPARAILDETLDAMSGREEPGLEGMPADGLLLRTFDLGARVVRRLAESRPLALLIDDIQWADEDSLRLLRYVFRSDQAMPIFLMLAIRPEELVLVNEAVTLLADMERAGVVRRLKVARFSLVETVELLRHVLGGEVDQPSATTIHAQAEGVPFVVEELARSYREGGMIQQVDGRWTLARNAERLIPSAVRTLIRRRAARLPETTTTALAQAAILGRRFSLKDLREVQIRLGDEPPDVVELAERLAPAVAAGLLVEHGELSAADYSFPHEQVRDFAAETLGQARRREVHAAVVELLLVGEPSAETLTLLAHHARAAGEGEICVRFSIDATRQALAAHAPEEVMRVVELALPEASSPQERLALLAARDQALEMLRRPADRLEGLAELAALAEALGDSSLELDVMLRRAAALRSSQEEEGAALVARRVRELAIERGDRETELAACLELGQDLLRSALGEGYVPPASEVDLDGAEEAYDRAAVLADELDDASAQASATRELGIIDLGRLRAWFVERVKAGEHVAILQRVHSGERLEDVMSELPVTWLYERAGVRFHRALELFEQLGDRRGMMSSIIAMAYLSWGADIHLGANSARHIEEIRRLATQMRSLTTESERAVADVQMLYGVHVFSRAKGIADLAITRGEEAFRQARVLGERSIEFLAAGGTALAHLDIGDADEAASWLERAAAVAAQNPTPMRVRQLELWRGLAHAARGDADGMRRHLERAVQIATEQGLAAGRCEALAALALGSARLGAESDDEALLSLAARAATEVRQMVTTLPGHPPWGAEADAALATIALARGVEDEAVEHARLALAALTSALQEDLHLHIVLPVARAILAAGTDEERRAVRSSLELTLAMIANRTADDAVRTRWFRGPVGAELSTLAGGSGTPGVHGNGDDGLAGSLDEDEVALLKLVLGGRTDGEIAQELGVGEERVARRLAEMFAKIGASSRADATAFAFRSHVM